MGAHSAPSSHGININPPGRCFFLDLPVAADTSILRKISCIQATLSCRCSCFSCALDWLSSPLKATLSKICPGPPPFPCHVLLSTLNFRVLLEDSESGISRSDLPQEHPPHFQFPFWHLHSCSLGPASSRSPGLETSGSEVLSFFLLACPTSHQLSYALEPHSAASHISHGICPLFSIPVIIPVIQILSTLHVDPGKHLLICLSSLVSSSPPPYTLWLGESL